LGTTPGVSNGYNYTFSIKVSYQPGLSVFSKVFDFTIYPAQRTLTNGSLVPVISAGVKFLPRNK